MERRTAGNDTSTQPGASGATVHPVSLATLSPELLTPFFHEFRTSLTMIKTCIALLTNPNISYDPVELREFMDIVRRGGDRVDRLVRDFLVILKLESGVAAREAREAKPTGDIVGAIATVIRSLQNDIAEHNVTVQVDAPASLPSLPISDEHLQMIVEKLLHNAVKFSKPEGGQIVVHVTPENSDVRFEVHDQGVGIPKKEQERIFDHFFQLTQAGLERQGAGLGLAVARGLVELYGGTIRVQSQVNVGSTFTFVLPKAPVTAPEAAPAAPAAPPAVSEEGVRLTAEEAFRRLGITFGEEKKPVPPEGAEGKKKKRRGLLRRRKK